MDELAHEGAGELTVGSAPPPPLLVTLGPPLPALVSVLLLSAAIAVLDAWVLTEPPVMVVDETTALDDV